jgi:hypothetical protein
MHNGGCFLTVDLQKMRMPINTSGINIQKAALLSTQFEKPLVFRFEKKGVFRCSVF